MWSGENLIYQETKTCIMKYRTDIELINGTFELIEEDTIDIDSIEELDIDTLHTNGFATDRIARKLNEVLQWAKQTDKEIKSIKEK